MMSKNFKLLNTAIVFLYLINIYSFSKSYLFRTSLHHHEVEYFSVINNLKISPPNLSPTTDYQVDGKNIFDPGGHIVILKIYNSIMKVFSGNELISVLKLRILSLALLLGATFTFCFLVYKLTQDLTFSLTTLFYLNFLPNLFIHGFLVRSFIFEVFFILCIIYSLIHIFEKEKIIKNYLILAVSCVICSWIRYNGTYLIAPAAIITLFCMHFSKIDKINKKSVITGTIVLANIMLVTFFKFKNISMNHTSITSPLNNLMLGHLISNANLTFFLEHQLFKPLSLIFILPIALHLSSKKKNSINNVVFIFYILLLIGNITASILNIYPLDLHHRHGNFLQISAMLLLAIYIHSVLRSIEIKFNYIKLQYPLILICISALFTKSNLNQSWESYVCNTSIKERLEKTTTGSAVYFDYLSWYEIWYYSKLKSYQNQELINNLYQTARISADEESFNNDGIYVFTNGYEKTKNKLSFLNKNFTTLYNSDGCSAVKVFSATAGQK